MGLMDESRAAPNTQGAGLPLPGAESDIPAAPSLSISEISAAISPLSDFSERAALFRGNEPAIRAALRAFSTSVSSGTQTDARQIASFIELAESFGRYLVNSSRPAEAMQLLEPTLDVSKIMKQPAAWSLVARYAYCALSATEYQAGAEAMSKHAALLVPALAGERDRNVVQHVVQVALALSEANLLRGDVQRSAAVAQLADNLSWNPLDSNGVGWRAEARYLLGKGAVAKDDYPRALKLFGEARKFQLTAQKIDRDACDLPDLPSLHYFSEVLVAQSSFRDHPAKLEAWLNDHPIPPGASSPPVQRLRADGYFGAGKLTQALGELEHALRNREDLQREHPLEAARVLSSAAQIHDQLGETKEALVLHRDAANLFARCKDQESEIISRRRHLEAAWELNIGTDALPADELLQAADELLELADTFRDVSRDIVFGNLARARALHQMAMAPALIEQSFVQAFSAARVLQQPEGPLFVCHYELALLLGEEGRFEEAATHAREARTLYGALHAEPDTDTVARLEGLIAEIAGARGDLDTFRISWRKVNALCKEGDVSGQAPIISDRLAAQFEALRDRRRNDEQEQ